jgi:glycosyltransferase involved in cell wall biosynthesis
MNKLSIIVTTLNSSKVITNLLDSLKNQTSKNFDLIIIDGGSIDETVNIIKNYNLTTHLSIMDGLTIYEGINKGITFCNTEYYLVCGSDDILFPNSIEIILETFISNNDIYIFSVYKGKKIIIGKKPTLLNRIQGWQSIISSHSVGTVIRTSIHHTLGFYDTKISILADGYFLTKVLKDKRYNKIISNEIIGNFGVEGTSNKNFYNNIFTTFLIQIKFYNFYLQLFILVFRLLKYRKIIKINDR